MDDWFLWLGSCFVRPLENALGINSSESVSCLKGDHANTSSRWIEAIFRTVC